MILFNEMRLLYAVLLWFVLSTLSIVRGAEDSDKPSLLHLADYDCVCIGWSHFSGFKGNVGAGKLIFHYDSESDTIQLSAERDSPEQLADPFRSSPSSKSLDGLSFRVISAVEFLGWYTIIDRLRREDYRDIFPYVSDNFLHITVLYQKKGEIVFEESYDVSSTPALLNSYYDLNESSVK